MDTASVDPYWISQIKEFLAPDLEAAAVPAGAGDQLREAMEAVQNGRHGNAAAAATLAMERSSGCPQAVGCALALMACSQLQQGRQEEAAATIAAALAQMPSDSKLTYSAGLIELRRGCVPEAIRHFERAVTLNPDQGHAWAALAIIRSLQQDHPGTEMAARRARDLNVPLAGRLVDVALLQATYRLGKPIESSCDFSALDESPDLLIERLLPRLPPVSPAAFNHPQSEQPILFVYADHAYVLKHAIPLLLSLDAAGVTCGAHLHVANPGYLLQPLIERLIRCLKGMTLVVSTESVQPNHFAEPAVYHSCVRYVRGHTLLRRTMRPVVIVDADLVALNDPTVILRRGEDADVILAHSRHDPLWAEIFAGCVAMRPTPGGLAYSAKVSALILDNLVKRRARWFFDQIALAVCRDRCGTQTQFRTLPKAAVASRTFDPSAYFSSVVNEQKESDNPHTRLQRKLLDDAGLTNLLATRPHQVELVRAAYGPMLIDSNDVVIGRDLKQCGHWCRHEIELLSSLLQPGQTVIDGGANVGSHAVPLARLVGPSGRVFAFEPQRLVFQMLAGNLAMNGLTNVFAYQAGLGRDRCTMQVGFPKFTDNFGSVRLCPTGEGSLESAEVFPLDELELDACHLIKLDVESMEYEAVEGARRTIERHRPVLYLENHESERRVLLIELIRVLGYRQWWHGVASRNPNMLCLPEESPTQVHGLEPVAS